MRNKLKFRILVFFSICMLCIGLTVRTLQNDTFYMIKLGNYILSSGIDLMDHWCWIDNLPYTYPHWLYDVFIALIYNNFDYLGVYVSTIITFIILILVVYLVNLKINKNEFMAFLVSIISIMALSIFATARAQIVSYIIFILEVFFIERLINDGKKRYLVYLMILSCLLANIHATIWLFYFVLFLPFIGEQIVYLIVNKFKIKLNNKLIIDKINNFKLLIIGFILSFVMGVFSPSRICYTYVIKVMMGNSQSIIQEHLPLVGIEHPLFLGMLLLIVLILVFSNTKIKLKELFMIGGLALMSLISARHVSLFYLIGILYISVIAIRCLNNNKDKTLDILVNIITNKKIVYVICFCIVFALGGAKFNYSNNFDYVDKEEYPVEAIKYIKENINLDDFRVYNGYNYGSYMMFNDIPIFIDSRCDLYLEEFNNKDLDIFGDAYNLNSYYDYEETFSKYNVNYVLINSDSILFKLLSNNSNYVIDYEDEYFTLFKVSSG